jgi:hypothetical protein
MNKRLARILNFFCSATLLDALTDGVVIPQNAKFYVAAFTLISFLVNPS